MRLNLLGFAFASVLASAAYAEVAVTEGLVLYADAAQGAAQVSEMATDALSERADFAWLEGRRNGGELALLSSDRFNRGKTDRIDTYSGALVADIERDSHYFGVLYGYGRSNAELQGDRAGETMRTDHYLLKVFGEEDFECFVAKASAEYMWNASRNRFSSEGRVKSQRYGVDFGLESRIRMGSFALMPYVGARVWIEDPRDLDSTRLDRQRVAEFPVGLKFGAVKRTDGTILEALLDLRYVRATGDTDVVGYVFGTRKSYEAFAQERGIASLAVRAQFEHANVGLRYGYTRAGGDREAHDAAFELGYRF